MLEEDGEREACACASYMKCGCCGCGGKGNYSGGTLNDKYPVTFDNSLCGMSLFWRLSSRLQYQSTAKRQRREQAKARERDRERAVSFVFCLLSEMTLSYIAAFIGLTQTELQ